jgi:hypothetical protein
MQSQKQIPSNKQELIDKREILNQRPKGRKEIKLQNIEERPVYFKFFKLIELNRIIEVMLHQGPINF